MYHNFTLGGEDAAIKTLSKEEYYGIRMVPGKKNML